MGNEALEQYTKEDLIRLIELYSKNWLALDGVWFQSIESKHGMDEAMYHDIEAWKRYTVIEARRIKQFLNLPEHPGLEGLMAALPLRFYGNLNQHELVLQGNKLSTVTLTAGCSRRAGGRACRTTHASRSGSRNTAALPKRLTTGFGAGV